MTEYLRNKMIAKARENGNKHGKTAELDFGAGAEWMHEQLRLYIVSQHRELLLAYEDYLNEYHTKEDRIKQVDKYLKANNCG